MHCKYLFPLCILFSNLVYILLVLDCFMSIWLRLVTMFSGIPFSGWFWVTVSQKRNLYMIWKAKMKQKPLFLEGHGGQTQ